MNNKKTFKFQLSKGDLFTLSYPSINTLSYIFNNKTENLIENVYTWCSPEQQALFDDNFILLNDLTNAILEYHYSVILEKPRLESFFEKAINDMEASALLIEDPTLRNEKLRETQQKREQTSPKPKPLMKAVLAYSQQSDEAINFNSWLRAVGEHLKMSVTEVGNMAYCNFIEASDSLTIQNDIRMCQEIEQEQERKLQKAKQR